MEGSESDRESAREAEPVVPVAARQFGVAIGVGDPEFGAGRVGYAVDIVRSEAEVEAAIALIRRYITGFGFNVRATELAEVGFGQYETTRFGMKGRVLPVYEECIDEAGFAFLGYVNGCLQRDPTEVGADLHVGIIGAQVAVSLAEAVDFVAGILMIDLQGDDLGCSPWD